MERGRPRSRDARAAGVAGAVDHQALAVLAGSDQRAAGDLEALRPRAFVKARARCRRSLTRDRASRRRRCRSTARRWTTGAGSPCRPTCERRRARRTPRPRASGRWRPSTRSSCRCRAAPACRTDRRSPDRSCRCRAWRGGPDVGEARRVPSDAVGERRVGRPVAAGANVDRVVRAGTDHGPTRGRRGRPASRPRRPRASRPAWRIDRPPAPPSCSRRGRPWPSWPQGAAGGGPSPGEWWWRGVRPCDHSARRPRRPPRPRG